MKRIIVILFLCALVRNIADESVTGRERVIYLFLTLFRCLVVESQTMREVVSRIIAVLVFSTWQRSYVRYVPLSNSRVQVIRRLESWSLVMQGMILEATSLLLIIGVLRYTSNRRFDDIRDRSGTYEEDGDTLRIIEESSSVDIDVELPSSFSESSSSVR